MARKTEAGIEFETWQSIPAVDPGFVGPMAFAMMLPAAHQLRQNARTKVSSNNLRQMALAMHNFESAFQRFPAGYSTNKEGGKLLSWRVTILPYLGEEALYDKFKKDEPWDSPNNKALIAEMPEVFRSPISQAKPGMTVYRGVGRRDKQRGGGMLRAPSKPGRPYGISFGAVTDGSSNTILLLETSDALAIEWTKPDEGLDGVDVDKQGIFGANLDGTSVAMGDGSTQFLLRSVSKKTLGDLMQMSSGARIDHDAAFKRSNRSRRSRRGSRREVAVPVDPFFAVNNGEVELGINDVLTPAEKQEMSERMSALNRANNLKAIGLAMLNFESGNRAFPAAYSTDPNGKPLLSWRVHVLPFLDESTSELHRKFNLQEPWDSQHNKALLNEMPDFFNSVDGQVPKSKTTVLAVGGPSGIISKPVKRRGREVGQRFGSISDGSTNTLLLVDAPDTMAVEWTKPVEFVPSENDIKTMLSREFLAAFADGHVEKIRKGLSLEVFKAILTRNGGEVFDKKAIGVRP